MEKSSEIRHLEALIDGQLAILEMITGDKQVNEILEAITNWVEGQANHSLLASILFVDNEGRHLLHGAAPSLPEAYNKAIHGIEIGPEVGSCGTAAFTHKQVIVEDIEHDPLWANFKELAMSYGLRACWSTPLLSKKGKVLGTFAIYYKETRKPTEEDFRIIQLVSQTTVLALEYKLAEMAKKESETYFQSMTESVPAMIWVARNNGEVVYMNKRWEELTGLSQEEIIKGGWQSIIHPDDFERVSNLLLESHAAGREYQVYLRIKTTGDYYRWHLSVTRPQKNEQGAVELWFGSAMDVHDQKILVEELEKVNEHSSLMADELRSAIIQMQDERKIMEDLLMNAPAIICILRGPNHVFELVNPQYQQLFPGRELVGKKVQEALPEADRQGFIDLLDKVYSTGEPFTGKNVPFRIYDQSGERHIYIDFLYHPLYKNGVIDGISVFASDVSAIVDAQSKNSIQAN